MVTTRVDVTDAQWKSMRVEAVLRSMSMPQFLALALSKSPVTKQAFETKEQTK